MYSEQRKAAVKPRPYPRPTYGDRVQPRGCLLVGPALRAGHPQTEVRILIGLTAGAERQLYPRSQRLSIQERLGTG